MHFKINCCLIFIISCKIIFFQINSYFKNIFKWSVYESKQSIIVDTIYIAAYMQEVEDIYIEACAQKSDF